MRRSGRATTCSEEHATELRRLLNRKNQRAKRARDRAGGAPETAEFEVTPPSPSAGHSDPGTAEIQALFDAALQADWDDQTGAAPYPPDLPAVDELLRRHPGWTVAGGQAYPPGGGPVAAKDRPMKARRLTSAAPNDSEGPIPEGG